MGRISWRMASFKSFNVGACERKHEILTTPPPPNKKSHVERSGEREGHGTSPKQEMRCQGNMFRTIVIDSCAVCAVAPSCWNHILAQFILFRRIPPRLTYWVFPIQKMSASRGSSCICRNLMFETILQFLFMFCWPCVLSQPVHRTATYMCEDTRCCIIQFWPPDDEHIVLETCRGI